MESMSFLQILPLSLLRFIGDAAKFVRNASLRFFYKKTFKITLYRTFFTESRTTLRYVLKNSLRGQQSKAAFSKSVR